MLFTNGSYKPLSIYIENQAIRQVLLKRYLGILLDPKLTFSPQTEGALVTAKKSLGKVSRLIKGGYGLPVNIGINLFKVLIRIHLEFGIPVWAHLSESNIQKLESFQAHSLRVIAGAKRNCSSNALNVILRILPFRLRIQELCSREFIRIQAKDESHILRRLLNTSFRHKNSFCPLEFIKLKSRTLIKELGDKQIAKDYLPLPQDILQRSSIPYLNLFTCNIGNSHSRTAEQKQIAENTFNEFQNRIANRFLSIYTDGSVIGNPAGYGACSAVLVPIEPTPDVYTVANIVGADTNNVDCELLAIHLALNMAIGYLKWRNKKDKTFFICSDSTSAIQIASRQRNFSNHHISLRKILTSTRELRDMGVTPVLVWVPAHANIPLNDMADQSAKAAAMEAKTSSHLEAIPLSKSVTFNLINQIVKKEWLRQWKISPSGHHTQELIQDVDSCIFLPKKRSIAISYIRSLLNDTILRDTMFKQGLEASPICICGNERETVDHFMLRCPIYATQRNDLFLSYKVITQQRMIPSLHHLIGHRWIKDLSVQDELKLKEAVFNYFKSTAKSL